VIAAEVDRPRLIEELHAAHARWGMRSFTGCSTTI
jgi:hypothetical protein